MIRSAGMLSHVVLPLILFSISLCLRLVYFQGFVLCDDVEEFALTEHLMANGFDFQGHLQYRFVIWLFNLLFMKLLGVSEMSFFVPTWLLSASFGALGYFCTLRLGYPSRSALLIGLMVVTAPFEIVLGTLRANDLFLAWFLALGMFAIIYFERRPIHQGISLAIAFWLAFYVKLWAVYVLPPLSVFFVIQIVRCKQWQGAVAFSMASVVLHTGTAAFWRHSMGTYLPFLTSSSATYPVPSSGLATTFEVYPRQIFLGSEIGTTLFGFMPYFFLGLLGLKLEMGIRQGHKRLGLDGLDLLLLVHLISFFLFLNFFPNSFRFDQYYSAPRIFRYLAPLSFPMALAAGKFLVDVLRLWTRGLTPLHWEVLAFCPIFLVNLWATHEATRPGRNHRGILRSVAEDVQKACPPQFISEAWVSYFFDRVYLRDSCVGGRVTHVANTHAAEDYEKWLARISPALERNSLLLTGLSSCVHYGCYSCGFQLRRFVSPLNPGWRLAKEYGSLDYLPLPEPVRLWRWVSPTPAGLAASPFSPPPKSAANLEQLFKEGIMLFDASSYAGARKLFEFLAAAPSAFAEDATYFYAVTYWREGNAQSTLREFSQLLQKYPRGKWAAGAHYHLGLAYRGLGDKQKARDEFQVVLKDFASDINLCKLAQEQLDQLFPASLWRK